MALDIYLAYWFFKDTAIKRIRLLRQGISINQIKACYLKTIRKQTIFQLSKIINNNRSTGKTHNIFYLFTHGPTFHSSLIFTCKNVINVISVGFYQSTPNMKDIEWQEFLFWIMLDVASLYTGRLYSNFSHSMEAVSRYLSNDLLMYERQKSKFWQNLVHLHR